MEKRSSLGIEQNLRPGRYSTLGFLGLNESLDEIIDHDNKLLSMLGVSHEQIADEIERLLKSVVEWKMRNMREWLERTTRYPDLSRPDTLPHFSLTNLPDINKGYLVEHLQIFMIQWRGSQPCPWGCSLDPWWGSIDLLILNRNSGEYFTGPGLGIHLIRNHHFFEGKETPYRIDPEKAVSVLDLQAKFRQALRTGSE